MSNLIEGITLAACTAAQVGFVPGVRYAVIFLWKGFVPGGSSQKKTYFKYFAPQDYDRMKERSLVRSVPALAGVLQNSRRNFLREVRPRKAYFMFYFTAGLWTPRSEA